jgi:spore coat protein U-like protein
MNLRRHFALLSQAAAALVLLWAAPAAAASSVHGTVTAVASASVTVLAPQAISAAQALTFGAVTRPANAVGVGGKTGAGGALVATRSGASGVFEIAGPPNTVYALSQSLRFNQPGLHDAVVVAEAPRAGAAGLLPASGAQEIRYSGAFKVDAAAPAGLYTGSLEVTANYN